MITIAICSTVLAVLICAACYASFICGYNACRHVDTDTPIITPLKQIFPTTVKETDEERLSRIRIENLENFGTNKPQKEVK